MGLAPLIVAELYDVVRQIAAEGISILLVEQFARTALAVADYAAVMTQGRIAMVGQPADLDGEFPVVPVAADEAVARHRGRR